MKSRKFFSVKDANQTKRATAISPLLSPPLQQPRRKGTSTKPWIVVSDSGESHVEVIGKHSIMRRTGLPARDLRILDPALSYPSTVLGRERAIVVNLEHIKAIITATEALVLDSNSPLVASFVEELQYHASNFQRTPRQVAESSDNEIGKTDKDPLVSHSLPSNHDSASPHSMGISEQSPIPLGNSSMIPEMKDSSPTPTLAIPKNRASKVLPFEFRMLEVCLESACKCLESETLTLEKEAYPALDELTSRISTLNLERVRQIKSRLVVISGRVQKVRDELEHLLDDDTDMAEMYLSDKLAHQQLEETSSRVELDDDAFEMDNESDEDSKSKVKSYYGSLSGFKPNIEDLEMLLEAYFTQIEGTLSKLSTLREYVDDTEDYINIMLDDKQNQLLQMGVMISTATLVLTGGIVVMGVLGMNIRIPLFKTTQTQFLETTFGTVGGCIVLYIIAIGFAKKRGLLA